LTASYLHGRPKRARDGERIKEEDSILIILTLPRLATAVRLNLWAEDSWSISCGRDLSLDYVTLSQRPGMRLRQVYSLSKCRLHGRNPAPAACLTGGTQEDL
ncbi:hypothetical protein CLAIMM_12035, partial [Cladophialophora immunda]